MVKSILKNSVFITILTLIIVEGTVKSDGGIDYSSDCDADSCSYIDTYLPCRYRTAQTKVEATKTRAYRLMDLVEARRRYKAEGTKCIHWR
jgi:hypothetical protein